MAFDKQIQPITTAISNADDSNEIESNEYK